MSVIEAPRDDVPKLTAHEWAALTERLRRYAFVCINKTSWEEAEDLAHDAVVRALDPEYARWDRSVYPGYFDFLAYLVRGLVSNRRQLWKTRVKASGKLPRLTHRFPAPDEVAAYREHARLRVKLLRERLAAKGDDLESRVVELHAEGIDTAPEQAEAMGCSVDEARAAWRRVKRVMEEVEQQIDAWDAEGGEGHG